MSNPITKQLILKDWYLQRWTIAGYFSAGALSVLLLSVGGTGSFYAGMIVLVTALIAFGIHLAMATVVGERTEHTLPFILTLPISNRDYTAAKVLGNLSMFLLPWTSLIVAVLSVLNARSADTRALIPWATVTLVEMLAAYCLLLLVSLVTESQAWTIGVMGASNLFFQAWLYLVSHMPSIAAGMKAKRIVWNPAAVTLLLIEVAVIVLLLALTFLFRSRKTDFV
jgi:ABC-2 type transport system permease protein